MYMKLIKRSIRKTRLEKGLPDPDRWTIRLQKMTKPGSPWAVKTASKTQGLSPLLLIWTGFIQDAALWSAPVAVCTMIYAAA